MASLAARLRVATVPAGDSEDPSSFARVHQHLARLRREGVQARVVPPQDDAWRWFEHVLHEAAAADLVWLQNVLLPPRLVRILARTAKRLVFDLDEPIDPESAARGDAEARERLERLCATLAVADLVIVDRGVVPDVSPECAPERVRVVPTGIPVGPPRARSMRSRLVVGWPGVFGLPVEALLPLVETASRREFEQAVELRLLVGASDPELAVLAAGRSNVRLEVVRGAGFEPLHRAFDAIDLACLPLAEGAGRLPSLALALPQSRGAAVAVCDRRASTAVAPHFEMLPVDGPDAWASFLRAALRRVEWLRAVGRRGQRSVRAMHSVDGAFMSLAVSLLRASAHAAPPRATLPLFPQVSRSSA